MPQTDFFSFHAVLLRHLNSVYFRHLIGFFLFLSLTIYTATKIPDVVDIHHLHHLPDVLRKADMHKLQEELLTCLPSLPHFPDLQKLREELKTALPSMDMFSSLSRWHVVELLYNCLPERFSHGNQTDDCVLVSCMLNSNPGISRLFYWILWNYMLLVSCPFPLDPSKSTQLYIPTMVQNLQILPETYPINFLPSAGLNQDCIHYWSIDFDIYTLIFFPSMKMSIKPVYVCH